MSQNAKRYPSWLRLKTKKARKAGFTLVELLVVMVIIIALAGVAIPLLGNLSAKASATSAVSGIEETNKVLQIHRLTQGGIGSGWDKLLDTTGTIFSGLHSNAAVDLSTHVLTASQAQSLVDAGCVGFSEMIVPTATSDKTFGINTGVLTMPATAVEVAKIAPSVITNELGQTTDPTKTYLAFGFGAKSSLIGVTGGVQDAPLGYLEKPASEIYSRFIVIVSVPTTATNQKARIVGVLSPDMRGLANKQAAYYEKSAD